MRKLAVFFIFGALVCSAAPKKFKISNDLLNVDPASEVNVIIQWKHAPSQTEEDKVLNRGGHSGQKLALPLGRVGLAYSFQRPGVPPTN